jgi:hypothetical protein
MLLPFSPLDELEMPELLIAIEEELLLVNLPSTQL